MKTIKLDNGRIQIVLTKKEMDCLSALLDSFESAIEYEKENYKTYKDCYTLSRKLSKALNYD